MKIVQDYTNIEPSATTQTISADIKTYNLKSDFRDYDSLNLMGIRTEHPKRNVDGHEVTNVLDVIFALTKDRDFFVTKMPHYRRLPKDLSDMEI